MSATYKQHRKTAHIYIKYFLTFFTLTMSQLYFFDLFCSWRQVNENSYLWLEQGLE